MSGHSRIVTFCSAPGIAPEPPRISWSLWGALGLVEAAVALRRRPVERSARVNVCAALDSLYPIGRPSPIE